MLKRQLFKKKNNRRGQDKKDLTGLINFDKKLTV